MKLLGGERPEYTLRTSKPRCIAGGNTLGSLVATVVEQQSSVLFLGNYEADLIETVSGLSKSVVAVVPEVDFAHELETRFADIDQVEIMCGDPDRFEPEAPFDLVVAAAGIEGATTPDSKIQSTLDFLKLVRRFQSPNGRSVISIKNPWSLRDYLVASYKNYLPEFDNEWPTADADDRQLGFQSLLDELGVQGETRAFAAFGPLDDLGSLVDTQVCDGLQDEFLWENSALSFLDELKPPYLQDPYYATKQALEFGQSKALAPRWVFVNGQRTTVTEPLPDAFVAVKDAGGRRGAVWQLELGDPVVWSSADEHMFSDTEATIVKRISSPSVVHCELSVQGELLDCLRQGDEENFKALLKGHMNFLQSAGTSRAFSSFSNTYRDGQEHFPISSVLQLEGDSNDKIMNEVFLVMHLRRLFNTVLGSGLSHFWHSVNSIDEAVVRSGEMLGRDLNLYLDEASQIEAKILDVTEGALDESGSVTMTKLRSEYASSVLAPGADKESLQIKINTQLRFEQLAVKNEQLERHFEPLQRRAVRLEGEIRRLKKEIRAERARTASAKNSRSYRLGHALMSPARLFKRGK